MEISNKPPHGHWPYGGHIKNLTNLKSSYEYLELTLM